MAKPTCPACGSKRLRTPSGSDPAAAQESSDALTCTRCGWSGQPFLME